MTPTGIFVSPDELERVRTAQECSGMYLSGGVPLGDPAYEVHKLAEKYDPPRDAGLSLKDGQFYTP